MSCAVKIHYWSGQFLPIAWIFKCTLYCNIFALHMAIYLLCHSYTSLASVASWVAVRSLSDPSKDFSQPRWVLIEARVTQILWGPLVQVVVQHRSCEQENMWGGFNIQKHQNIQKIHLFPPFQRISALSETVTSRSTKLTERVEKVVDKNWWVRGHLITVADISAFKK